MKFIYHTYIIKFAAQFVNIYIAPALFTASVPRIFAPAASIGSVVIVSVKEAAPPVAYTA